MPQPGDGRFPTTHWTLIARLKSDDAACAHQAIEALCTQYHYPLYAYIRRRGLDHHDAEDVLQDFFAKMLRLSVFEQADESKGRLRGFLALSLQRFVFNWRRDERHHKATLSLQEPALTLHTAEKRYELDAASSCDTPEQAFERQWARQMIQNVLGKLQVMYTERGKGELYEQLLPALLAGGTLRDQQPANMAVKLGMTENALRVSLRRLLDKFRDVLRAEVAQTVETEEDVQPEIDYLMGLFAR